MKKHFATKQGASLQLYLVRHGESCWNVEHRLTGWSDIPLTEKGRAQARSIKPLLEGLHFDGVWSSDLLRASDTARLAYAEPVEDERLRELFFGDLEGAVWTRLEAEYKNALLDFENFRSPGGESLQEARARVMEFVGELSSGRHLLFIHGGIVRIFLAALGDSTFVSNCTVVAIDWTDKELIFIKEPPPVG